MRNAFVEAFEPFMTRLDAMSDAIAARWPAFARGAEMAGWHGLTAAGVALQAPASLLDGLRSLLPAGHATPESVAATALAADASAQAAPAPVAPPVKSYPLGALIREHARTLHRGVDTPELAPLPRRVSVWLDGLSPEDRSWLSAFNPQQIERHLAAKDPSGLLPGVPRLTSRRELAAHDEDVRRGVALLMDSGRLDQLIAERQGLDAPVPRAAITAPEPDAEEALSFRI
ncbi:hypothetical protein [uncultured Methylobacterium sp.]|uniref:hypothetical protein n=1 Tax=uncultured Methylobacterium sp. TaxID=157278 RepID=UPI0026063B8C|nr:hypothetical protein [uncultured Methylobacterium sp.]